jgi:hypothetical protein
MDALSAMITNPANIEPMQIRPQSEGYDSGSNNGLRYAKAEMASVPNVDPDTALNGAIDHRVNLTVGRNEAAGVPGEGMRDVVAFVEKWLHLTDDVLRVDMDAGLLRPQGAQVNVDGNLRGTRGLLCKLQRLNTPARVSTGLGMDLDTPDDVRIFSALGHNRVDIDPGWSVQVDVLVAMQSTGQIRRDEAQHLRSCTGYDEFAKSVDGEAARTSLINDRRYPTPDANIISIERKVSCDMLEYVCMGVDKSGENEKTPHIPDCAGPIRRDSRLDRGDLSPPDSDIVYRVDFVRWVNDPATLQQQVETERGRSLPRIRLHPSSSGSDFSFGHVDLSRSQGPNGLLIPAASGHLLAR